MKLLEFNKAKWSRSQRPWDFTLSTGDITVCEISQSAALYLMSEKIMDPSRVQEGHIRIKGYDLSDYTVRELDILYAQFGWIFRELLMVSTLSMEENLWLPLMTHSPWLKLELQAKIMRWIKNFDFGYLLQVRPAGVSTREQKIVSVIRAFVHDPAIVISFMDFSDLADGDVELIFKSIQSACKLNQMGILIFQRQGKTHPYLEKYKRGADIICD